MSLPYTAITSLWALLLVVALWFAVANARRWSRTRRLLAVSVVVIVAIAMRSASRTTLYGLEYEDAYEYSYSGLLMARSAESRASALNPVCDEGSLADCVSLATLSHPTGLSVLVSWLARGFGESTKYVTFISMFFWAVLAAATHRLARHLGLHWFAGLAGIAVTFCVPVWFTLGSSSLAEPTSAGLTGCALVLSYKLMDERESHNGDDSLLWSTLVGLLLVICLALAACVKREGLLLAMSLPLIHTLRIVKPWSRGRRRAWGRWLVLLAACLGSTALAAAITGGHVANVSVVQPGSGPPFAFEHLLTLTPRYVWHFFSIAAYGLLTPLVALSVFHSSRRDTLALFALCLMYGLMFCSFGQDYYFDRQGQIPWFHFQRYSLQLAPMLGPLAAIGVDCTWRATLGLGGRLRTMHRVWLALLLMSVGWSLARGVQLRAQLVREEWLTRMFPTQRACEVTGDETWIVTAEPILYSLFCGAQRRVISLESLGSERSTISLASKLTTENVFLVESAASMESDRARYPGAYGALNRFTRDTSNAAQLSGTDLRIQRLMPSRTPFP